MSGGPGCQRHLRDQDQTCPSPDKTTSHTKFLERPQPPEHGPGAAAPILLRPQGYHHRLNRITLPVRPLRPGRGIGLELSVNSATSCPKSSASAPGAIAGVETEGVD